MCVRAQACFGWALLGISSGRLHRKLPLRHIHVRNRQIHWVSSPKCPNEDSFLYFEDSTTAGEALYCPGPIFGAFSSSFSPGANPTIAGRGEGCRYLMFFYHFHQRLLFIPRLSPEAPRDKNSAVCLGRGSFPVFLYVPPSASYIPGIHRLRLQMPAPPLPFQFLKFYDFILFTFFAPLTSMSFQESEVVN